MLLSHTKHRNHCLFPLFFSAAICFVQSTCSILSPNIRPATTSAQKRSDSERRGSQRSARHLHRGPLPLERIDPRARTTTGPTSPSTFGTLLGSMSTLFHHQLATRGGTVKTSASPNLSPLTGNSISRSAQARTPPSALQQARPGEQDRLSLISILSQSLQGDGRLYCTSPEHVERIEQPVELSVFQLILYLS